MKNRNPSWGGYQLVQICPFGAVVGAYSNRALVDDTASFRNLGHPSTPCWFSRSCSSSRQGCLVARLLMASGAHPLQDGHWPGRAWAHQWSHICNTVVGSHTWKPCPYYKIAALKTNARCTHACFLRGNVWGFSGLRQWSHHAARSCAQKTAVDGAVTEDHHKNATRAWVVPGYHRPRNTWNLNTQQHTKSSLSHKAQLATTPATKNTIESSPAGHFRPDAHQQIRR